MPAIRQLSFYREVKVEKDMAGGIVRDSGFEAQW